MKRFRLLIANVGLLLVMTAPLMAAGTASAATVPVLQCSSGQEVIVGDRIVICDLGVNKQASVHGGAYQDADTSNAAVAVHVGDTVTWKITITDNSTAGLTPHGVIYIKDLLPAGVHFVSSVASDGNYIGDDGSFFANHWFLPLLKSDGESFVTTLPATLTITTKATGTGLIENSAQIDKYDPGSCDGGCVYYDNNSANNQNDAWINSQSAPKVLASSTVVSPDTGFGKPNNGLTSALLIELGLFGLAAGLIARKRQLSK